jgi:hypothetical protein
VRHRGRRQHHLHRVFLVLAVVTAMALGPRLRLAPWPRFPAILPAAGVHRPPILSALLSRDRSRP